MLTASWAGGKMAATGVGLMGSLESQDVSFPGASGRLPFMSHQPELWSQSHSHVHHWKGKGLAMIGSDYSGSTLDLGQGHPSP